VLATALLWWLAGQRWGLFALGWIALVPLFYALQDLNRRERWKFGWRAGVVCFALINWWLIPTITRGSPLIGVPSFFGFGFGLFGVAFIAVVHGVQVALVSALWNPDSARWRTRPWLLPLCAAALWTLFDALRCETPLAHPWGALAYTQWRDLAFLQSARLVGQHGLTFLCVWFAASWALWLVREQSPRLVWRAPALVFAVLHLWGAWRLVTTPLPSRELWALLVQTNVSSLKKGPGTSQVPFAHAMRLTQSTAVNRFDVVAWPETTAAFLRSELRGQPFYSGLDAVQVQELARHNQTSFLVGAHANGTSQRGEPALWNQGVLWTPDGEAQSSGKARVVPFGERAPFGELVPLLNQFAPQPAIEAETGKVLQLKTQSGNVPIGVLICFESCFSHPASDRVREGAKVLWVLTNDEWFTGSNAPWDHAAMATLRAVENDVPVVQVANGGYSFVVDRRGRFLQLYDANRTLEKQDAHADGSSLTRLPDVADRVPIGATSGDVVKTSYRPSSIVTKKAPYPWQVLPQFGEAQALAATVPVP
jgi:apolipoprotein N-acyltransferase